MNDTEVAQIMERQKILDEARRCILRSATGIDAEELAHRMTVHISKAEELISELESVGKVRKVYIGIRK